MNFNEVYIIVKTKKQISKVLIKDILYIEKDLRLTVIHTTDKVYSFYGRMEDIYKGLGNEFYKCHSRCILNLNRVTSMEDGIFYLDGGKTLRIGQNYYQYTKKIYEKFLKSRL
ncbi:LytR/AlgR family response regulator transcription factor [Anaerovorax odorimutans]|uniref:LytR/AlgR family response regulator transcription factor n=1 Tax=Anaerovorax odorimutans TaxID=109327 RepID=UPI000420C05A|nr:LytTR family DNA-binding domain-containing protein [Anaerovorax odorimutans]